MWVAGARHPTQTAIITLEGPALAKAHHAATGVDREDNHVPGKGPPMVQRSKGSCRSMTSRSPATSPEKFQKRDLINELRLDNPPLFLVLILAASA
jgi:hypothetical protein